ncbi:MAG: chemotaxis protein CheW [Nitrospinota bacterium]
MELLTFKLDNVLYGIDLNSAIEIVPLPYITKFGNLPSYICGIIDLRGRTVPIIDLKARIGTGKSRFELDNNVIIVSFQNKKIGLIVDTVVSLEKINEFDFIPPPTMLEGVDISFMKAAVNTPEGLLISLSLEHILRVEDVAAADKNYI